jgi:NAD(P)-dependent dehydrogenase (short-subunit alcohol dehydrogenase family)
MGMTQLEQPIRRYPEMAEKLALVTSGSSGIGLATAQAFAREGGVVVLASRTEERAQTALQTFPEGSAVSWIACDTADPVNGHGQCGRLVQKPEQALPRGTTEVDPTLGKK